MYGMGEAHLDVHDRAAEAQVRRRGRRPVPAKIAYRETITRPAEADGPPREADRRSRPVRASATSRSSRSRAAAGSSSSTRSSAARSRSSSSPRSRRASQDDGRRAWSAATRWSTSGSRCRRQVPQRGLLRHGVPDRGLARAQGGGGRRPASSCSSRSCELDVVVPESHTGDIMGDLNAKRGQDPGHRVGRRRQAARQGARCRRPRSRATRSTCAR